MLKEILSKVGEFSAKKPMVVIGIVILLTIFAATFIPNIKKQTSYEKMLPQDLPEVQEVYEVRDEFGGTDIVTIAVKVVPSDSSDKVTDIRDPRVLRAVKMLEDNLKTVDGITSVSSPVDVLIEMNGGTVPQSIDRVKELMRYIPESQRERMFNKDYSVMVITAFTDVGADEKKCDALYNAVKERIEETPFPAGVEAVPTGSIPMRAIVGRLMDESQAVTTTVAFLAIMLIIVLHFKKITSVALLSPLIFTLIWTGGFMGLFGLPLDMATTSVGSLILGLGIDYGIYFGSRYKEEREKGKSPEEAAITTVTYAGSSVLASAATTAAGLLSLTIAPLPAMANLGKVCAVGIAFCCILTVVFLPAVLVLEDKYLLPMMARLKRRLMGQ